MSLEEKIRLIPHRIDPASKALAIDRMLLKNMDEALARGEHPVPVFRVHQFSKPSVILSYGQKVNGRFNEEIAKRLGVELTRRDTGGGHMFFSPQDVHFAFIAPNYYFSNNLHPDYRKVNAFIIKALRKMGYDADFGTTSIRIKDNGRKIVAGTARRNSVRAALQQGGILVEDYDEEIFELLMAKAWEKREWKEKVTCLNNYPPSLNTLIPALYSSFNGYNQELSETEESQATKLQNEVYSNPDVIYSGSVEQYLCMVAGRLKSDKDKVQEVTV